MEKRLFPVDIPSGWLCPAQSDRVLLSRMRRHTRNSCPAARTYCALFLLPSDCCVYRCLLRLVYAVPDHRKASRGHFAIGMHYRDIYLWIALAIVLLNWLVKICFSPSLALRFLDKHSISDFSVPAPAHADADPHREMHLLPGLFQMHNHFPAESH